MRRLERRELAIERHEVRLARLDARSLAHSNTAAAVAAQTGTLVSVNNLGNAGSSTSSTVSAAASPSARPRSAHPAQSPRPQWAERGVQGPKAAPPSPPTSTRH